MSGKFDTDSIKRGADILREAGTLLQRKAGTGGGEYSGPCPSCGGQDRFIVQPNHPRGGRALCRQCHPQWMDVIGLVMWREHCSFLEACARLGGERPASPADSRSTPSLQTAEKRKPDFVFEYRDLGPGGPETDPLMFQVLRWEAQAEGERKQIKQRRPDPERPGEWLYNLNGVNRVLYNYRALAETKSGDTVYLTEGEKKCQALIEHGRIATTSPGGSKNWREHYGPEFGYLNVVILPDNDDDGRAYALAAATSIYPGAASVKIVDLPGLDKKGDVYDWLASGHTFDELDVLVAATPVWQPPAEPEPEPRRRRLMNLDDLDNQPPLTWSIDGIFPAGSLACAYGASGSGKTFWSLDCSLSIAAGIPWLDHQVNAPGPVVYIAAEGSAGLKPRTRAWRNTKGIERVENFYVLNDAINMLDPKATVTLLTDIEAELPEGAHPALIVIDTLARCMVGGDENSSKDMGLFIASADTLRRATGATVLIIHHTGKAGSDERGSSALRAACDTMIAIDNNDGLITVECTKQKDAVPFDTFHLALTPVGESCVITTAGPGVVTGTKGTLTPGQRRILEVVNSVVLEGGASFTELKETAAISAMSLTRHLEALINRGLVEVSGPPQSKSRRYHPTTDGKLLTHTNISVTVTNSDLGVLVTNSNTPFKGVTVSDSESDSNVSDFARYREPPPPSTPCDCGSNEWRPNRLLKRHECPACGFAVVWEPPRRE